MSKVSGVLVENISKILGVSSNLIKFIGPINTLDLPGWPSGGGCETLSLGYTSGPPPPQACTNPRNEYQFDTNTSILYDVGELCGGELAPDGFYSDGSLIYTWFGGIWEVGAHC
jgi:hypothetical protein